ncbi:hypothetical protein C1646_685179 [Rhizophagus diaphanus]|nr:hypothetical protein C1646_685179 [Rhizophagus diaphanus] [Rhizophagus sp. MUCL 43196]
MNEYSFTRKKILHFNNVYTTQHKRVDFLPSFDKFLRMSIFNAENKKKDFFRSENEALIIPIVLTFI